MSVSLEGMEMPASSTLKQALDIQRNNFLASLGDLAYLSREVWASVMQSASGLLRSTWLLLERFDPWCTKTLTMGKLESVHDRERTKRERVCFKCVSPHSLYMWYYTLAYHLRLIAKRSLNSVMFKKRSHCGSIEPNSDWTLKTKIWA